MDLHNAVKRYPALVKSWAIRLGVDQGGLERAGETVTPTIDLLDPETAFLRAEMLAEGYDISGAGGAGTYALISLYNYGATNRIVIVESAIIAMGVGDTVHLRLVGYAPTGVAASDPPQARDTRWFRNTIASRKPTAQIHHDAQAVPGGIIIGRFYSAIGGPLELLRGPVILSPFYGLVVSQALAATALPAVTFQWRERLALPNELTG